jgi:adenosylcobinamide kinase/adenosylcobinamide-phosphate guanylyltransferase
MSLYVLTGGARSGKSALAERLAASRGAAVTVAVAGSAADDPEMARRIARHRADRPASWRTLELDAAMLVDHRWLHELPPNDVLLLDCLGTLAAALLAAAIPLPDEPSADAAPIDASVESELDATLAALVAALGERTADTVVVTNEVGDGLVPAYPAGRLFRDALGRANRALVDRADGAWLVVAGRALDLSAAPGAADWPPPGL